MVILSRELAGELLVVEGSSHRYCMAANSSALIPLLPQNEKDKGSTSSEKLLSNLLTLDL